MRGSSSLIRRCRLVVLSALALASAPVAAQQVGRAPVEVRIPMAAVAMALGRAHFVYEVHLTNFGATPLTVERLDVLDDGSDPFDSRSGDQLARITTIVGAPAPASRTSLVLPPGARSVSYLWVSLPPGRPAPDTLSHRLTFSNAGVDPVTLSTPAVSISAASELPIAAPVSGGPWVAVRGPSNSSGHRVSLVASAGEVRVPQRFAVDWVRIGDDGRLFGGDPAQLSSWYGYGAPVYAVADGTVVRVSDGAADGTPLSLVPPAVVEADDATGNVVVLDLGNGRFATYAHLKAGSMSVVEGDHVVRGQMLARIGNSGNSLAPHLHFHVSDTREPLGGEGLPVPLDRFDLIGRASSLPALLSGTPWTANAAQPARVVAGEIPLENMVVRFADTVR